MSKENKVNFNAKNKTISHGLEYDVTYTYCKDDQTLEFYDDNGVYVGSVNSDMLDMMKKDLEYAKEHGSLEPEYVSFFDAYTDMYNNTDLRYTYDKDILYCVQNGLLKYIDNDGLIYENLNTMRFLEKQRWYKIK